MKLRRSPSRTALTRTALTRTPRCAETAWVLRELCEIGIRLRARGWCLGELHPADVRWSPDGGLARSPDSRSLFSPSPARRASRHRRRGHDRGCVSLGVPLAALRRLLVAWTNEDAATLLEDAVSEAIEDVEMILEGSPWSAAAAREAVQFSIGNRITPVRPEQLEAGAKTGDARFRMGTGHRLDVSRSAHAERAPWAVNQIPRSASN